MSKCFITASQLAKVIAEDRVRDAAPEMLAALKAMYCAGCGNRIGFTGDQDPGWRFRSDWRTCDLCKNARAAIAAAEGVEAPEGEKANG